ncbi:MAG: M13 family metallopeptidase [Candidatus Eisenbacteria bacterium]
MPSHFAVVPRLVPVLGVTALVLALAAPVVRAQKSGVNRAHMDTNVEPCRDFYRYANGKWLDTAEIPESYTGIGSGREIADRNQEITRAALEKAAANAAKEKDPTLKKVGLFYSALMDSGRADREGLAPIAGELAAIARIRTREELRSAFARNALMGVGAGFAGRGIPFRIGSEADPKKSTVNIAQIFQGGLGLPERDFYFRPDPRSEAIRKAYVQHVANMLRLMGDGESADKTAQAIMALETALAESSMTRVAMRDPHLLYNKITVKELSALCPAINWPAYFKEVGLPALANDTATLDVSQPVFMRQLSRLLESTPIETWRDLVRVNVARSAAPWLGQKFYDETFAIQSQFTGTKTPPARWKRASQVMDFAMGEAVGQAYVATAFPPSSKTRMLEMVANIRGSMKERIETRPWMSAATKKEALAKLETILLKIGYPDQWRDYSKLDVDASASAIELLRRASAFEVRRNLDKIGKPVDRTEWFMSPPQVNAYYNPSVNEIVFPAGILQPPYFDPKVDDAYNYGSIGMVIGHEITHGFDDEGSQYDKVGNLQNWWGEDDRKEFETKAQQVVDQYNAYVGVDTLKVNGKLTLGENIADIGGLTIAFHAWKRSLKGKPAPVIDGYTGEQRFFLGHAQGWRRKLRPELTRTMVLTDPHSPAVWRVNGPLSVMPEFMAAFGCKTGDTMVRDEKDRPAIW